MKLNKQHKRHIRKKKGREINLKDESALSDTAKKNTWFKNSDQTQ
jgi:hypothetical protein